MSIQNSKKITYLLQQLFTNEIDNINADPFILIHGFVHINVPGRSKIMTKFILFYLD